MDLWINLRVKHRKQLTPNVVLLEFVAPNGQELPRFSAGSYIDIQIPGGQLRPYSLCNAPHDTSRYSIAVRREERSRGASLYLHDRLRVGDSVTVRHPLNEFQLHASAPHSTLFGGGVGVAPLLSMAEDLWRRGASFDLHVSAKNPEATPFMDYLRSMPFRSRVHLHMSEVECGRLNFDRAMKKIMPLSHVYLCGPGSFMSDGIQAAVKEGISQERLHFEHFD